MRHTGGDTLRMDSGRGTNTGRLARAIDDRRIALGLNKVELAKLSGLSPDTVLRFTRGQIPQTIQKRILDGFELALGWSRGSCKSILAGGEPELVSDYSPTDAALKALEPLNGDGDEWCPVPRWMVVNLAAALAELGILTRHDDSELSETVTRANTLATDMMALMVAAERGHEDLTRLVERLGSRAVKPKNRGHSLVITPRHIH